MMSHMLGEARARHPLSLAPLCTLACHFGSWLKPGAAAMLTPTEGAGTTADTDVPPICGAIRWSHPSLAEIAGAGLS